MLVISLALAGVFFRLQQTPTVSADTNDKSLAESTYPNIVGSRIDTCALCHTSSIPNLNPYGAAYKAQGRFLTSSLKAIEALDSDGDKFTNLQEIMALTFPGDSTDHPPVLPKATNTTIPTKTPATAPTSTPTATLVGVVTNTPTVIPVGVVTNTPTVKPVGVVTNTPTITSPKSNATRTAVPTTTKNKRTPTVRPTGRPSTVPTCVKSDDDKESNDDGRRTSLNCKQNSDTNEKESLNSDNEDNSKNSNPRLSNNSDDKLDGLSSFLNNLFVRFNAKKYSR